jgi:ADP-heptose:LPS heptosyltransferase
MMRGSMTDRPRPAQTRRILAVRVGRGGDLVMVTPALRLLLDAFPQATLDLWTGEDGPRVLRGLGIDRFLVEPRRFPSSWLSRARLARQAAGGYDRAYVFETHGRWARLTKSAAPEQFVLRRSSPREHFADRCLDLVEHSLSEAMPRPWASLPVTDAARARAAEYLEANGVLDARPLVGLQLTYSGSGRFADDRRHREWPHAEAVKLARRLAQERPDVRCVLDVTPDELPLLEPFLAEAGGAVTLLTGPPDFERYKAVLERLSVLVTPNTGPMHFAAAVGTPVVALFSHWSPAECGPFAPPGRAVIVRAEDQPHGERGLAAIPADVVFEALTPLLP